MKPIIKWPGGKSRELEQIIHLIPKSFGRYVEPFFGGGALYFHLMPKNAAINDVSASLIDFYRLVKAQDPALHALLMAYSDSFKRLISVCDDNASALVELFMELRDRGVLKRRISRLLLDLKEEIWSEALETLVLDRDEFFTFLKRNVVDKYERTLRYDRKRPFSQEDLRENLITGFASGYYMYFRKIHNDILLGRIGACTEAYRTANFYFIREFCYGSMFRYNSKGEFNIPYGGRSYNRKDLGAKIRQMFDPDMAQLLAQTEIHCSDFERFFERIHLNSNDFIFLDPPYDTEFSDYDGNAFTKNDQQRLANALKQTQAKFIMVIKNTDFIYGLYEKDFHILSFDKQYTYHVKSRNERDVEHLIITNLPV